jgi:hypothetical protein
MSKDVINVKSNGIRNELKEIRKSIDTLTHAMVEMIDIMAQTHTQNESKICTCSNSHDDELRNTAGADGRKKVKV